MSNQDYEGLDDLLSAIRNAATSGHSGPNAGRIFDGCLFITEKEWNNIPDSDQISTRAMTTVEKLSSIPIRIIRTGESAELSDNRIIINFSNTLYLMPSEVAWHQPPLPRLYVDGRYISSTTP